MAAADPNSNIASLYLIPVSILSALALVLFILRIWTRINRTRRLYLDDWLIVAAEPLSIINFILGASATGYGWGRKLATISPSDYTTTMKLQFALQTTWLFTLCLVRLSVACSLLRFGREWAWRSTLYIIMGLQVLLSSSYVVIQFAQCKPVSSNWEMVADVVCWDTNAIVDYGWAVAAVYIVMDLTLSLMPIKLIRTLNRSTSEKFLIGCLMALGLAATAVAAAKMTTFTTFGSGDPMQATIKPSMYAKLEEVVGIIASCLPPLKAPIQQLLKRMGILKERQLSRPSFVNTLAMGTLSKEQKEDQRSIGDGSDGIPLSQVDSRVDSVSVKPGSSYSRYAPGHDSHKEAWVVV